MRASLAAVALSLLMAAAAFAQVEADVHLSEPLAEGVWMHVSYQQTQRWGRIRSNGLVVARGDGEAVLIDTAWNDEQTSALLRLVRDELGRKVVAAVSTHAHNDKMGGVATLRDAHILTFAHPVANALAPDRGLMRAEFDLAFGADGMAREPRLAPVEVLFPGAGHTVANLVVHAPQGEVLFGGCLIRPGSAFNLGNTADGDVQAWGASVQAAAERFPAATIVVPSHGKPGGRELLTHTARLAEAAVAGD
ncbi:MAG: subclass B1 metallo-beta-lactamase [Pseudomonadota bacterium]